MNPIPCMQPDSGEIHLWLVDLEPEADEMAELLASLSDDERARAERIRIPGNRSHFIVARGVMRKILGASLSSPPDQLGFVYGVHGKPELQDAGSTGVHFNLSHSCSLALLAINRTYQIGVDIERTRPERPLLKIAERFFSAREMQELRTLPGKSLQDGFYSCWTRKEAYLKAIGTGLATPLNAFDVTLRPDDPPALAGQRLDATETCRWRILDIEVPAGYRAAVATRWESPRIVMRQWHADA